MTEEEILKRTITPDEITKKAMLDLNNGFRGKAVVAFIDLLGFSEKISSEWYDESNDPLLTLLEFKCFLEIMAEKIKTIQFYDYGGERLLQEVKIPRIVTVSDSFMFLLPLDETNEQTILCSVLGVISPCLDLWQLCIDKGFTIRGGIEYGNLYYNNLDIVGEAFLTAYKLESKIAVNSRIILSNNIKEIINKNIDGIHNSIRDYFLRFLYKDKDGYLAINPVMKLAYTPSIAEQSLAKLMEITSKIKDQKILSKYDDLIDRLRAQDLNLQDRNIYEN